MILKRYQEKVVVALRRYLQTAAQKRQEEHQTLAALTALPAQMVTSLRAGLDWVRDAAPLAGVPHLDAPRDGLGRPYPRQVIKVPTGGGKTLLAVEAIREYQTHFAQRATGLVVWVVPSETIYAQTVSRLRDRTNWLRQLLDQVSAGHTLILEKGQRLTRPDVDENLVVLFVMIQSISRRNAGEALKVFQDSGGFDHFFPPDHRLDLHTALLNEIPNLETIGDVTRSAQTLVRSSLANAIRICRPLLIVDEIHKVFSPTARETLDRLNPAFVLGFSATPTHNSALMNVLVSVSGRELLDEDMVKLDLHILPPAPNAPADDWQAMLRELVQKRQELEAAAETVRRQTGRYVRPAALIQVEATGANQRGLGRVHSLDVKEYLVKQLGIPDEEIAIKTSAQNDLEDRQDLFSSACPIRYFITRDALREGWDFSYCYLLGIIPNVSSTTGMTQLIGRILRQPHARKFGVAALDESYVYFVKGSTQELIEQVRKSFQSEGLDDLLGQHVTVRGAAGAVQTRTASIRPEFATSPEGFYLPVWVIADAQGAPRRRFSYAADIAVALDFADWQLAPDDFVRLGGSLTTSTTERQTYSVSIDDAGHMNYDRAAIEAAHAAQGLPVALTARRLADIIPNPFVARQVAERVISQLYNAFDRALVGQHYGFLLNEVSKLLAADRQRQEESRFRALVADGTLVLVVSDEARMGYRVPATETVPDDGRPSIYRAYLYDAADAASLNGLERNVAQWLDRQPTILWWFRNRVSAQGYAVRGWRRHQIRPDFIAARRRPDDGSLDLVYVLESKGDHLAFNLDSVYKQEVFNVLNDQPKQVHQTTLEFGKLNERVSFAWLAENEAEVRVRTLFNAAVS